MSIRPADARTGRLVESQDWPDPKRRAAEVDELRLVGCKWSSMTGRVFVKVRGCGLLAALPVASAEAWAEAFQSSIRPRGAGQSAVRCSGAQSEFRPSVR